MPGSHARFRDPKTNKLRSRFSPVLMAAASFAMPFMASHAQAALTWINAGPTNNWSTVAGNENWTAGPTVWVQGEDAIFGVTDPQGAIAVTSAITVNDITFNGAQTISNGAGDLTLFDANSNISVAAATTATIAETITGVGSGITKLGTGTLVLSGANTYSGGTTVGASSGQVTATVSTTQNSIGTGAASIGAGSTLQLNNTNTSGSTVTIGNTFTGTGGILKLNFAAGGSARNTTMANVTGFDGTIQLSNSGANPDKWNTGAINAPNAIVEVNSGSQLFMTGVSTFERVDLLGTGNTENRGAIRLTSTLNAPLRLLGNATIGGEGGVINGTISTGVAGTSTLTLGTTNSNNLPNNMLNGVISNGIGTLALNVFNQNGGGVFINGASLNTYSGGTTLLNSSSGTRLVIGGISGTPYGSGAITVGQAATDKAGIYFITANQTLANNIVMNTALGTDRPGLRSDVTNVTLSGQLTANLADAMFSTNGTGSFNLTGRVTGNMGLTLDNQFGSTLSVTLNNAAENNDYAGNTNIEATKTTLILGRNNQIPNGLGKGNVVLDGRLNLNGFSDTINGLSGNGILDGVSGTPTFTIGDNNATSTFGGVITDTAGALTINKIGNGVLTLTGTNTYAGPTNVNGGTLRVNGSIASAVTVNSGATLGGTGTINNLVVLNNGATLSPGASIESLNTGNNTWIGNTNFVFEFSNDGTPGVAGTDYDLLAITGSLNMSSATTITLDLVTMTNATNPGLLAGWNPFVNTVWSGFVTTTTGIVGYDADKFAFNISGFQNQLHGNFSVVLNGNNLDLRYITIPEPATMSLLALGSLGLLRRRRVVE